MAQPDREEASTARDLTKRASVAGASLYLVATAANQGFVRAFDIPRATLIGIDQTLIFDPTVVFAFFLGGLLFAVLATVVASAALLRRWWRTVDRLPDLHGVVRVLVLAAVALALLGMARYLATIPIRVLAVTCSLLVGATLALSRPARNAASRVRTVIERRAAALFVVALSAAVIVAYELGGAWGTEVRTGKRTREPLLAVILMAQWPQGAALAPLASDHLAPTKPDCVVDMLLGERNGHFILYNAVIDRVHDAPASRHLVRTTLRDVRRSGCPGPAWPASAR